MAITIEQKQALLAGISAELATHSGDTPLTLEMLERIVTFAAAFEGPKWHAPEPAPIPPTVPDWPKLLVSYGSAGTSEEQWIVINSWQEWLPYHHWYVRPMGELESLKQRGVPERKVEKYPDGRLNAELVRETA